MNTAGTHALVAQLGGRVHLVGLRQDDNKGTIEQVYALKDSDQIQNVSYESGVTFVSKCQLLVYGCADGSSLVWNKDNAELVYELDHGESEIPSQMSLFSREMCTNGHSSSPGTIRRGRRGSRGKSCQAFICCGSALLTTAPTTLTPFRAFSGMVFQPMIVSLPERKMAA